MSTFPELELLSSFSYYYLSNNFEFSANWRTSSSTKQ